MRIGTRKQIGFLGSRKVIPSSISGLAAWFDASRGVYSDAAAQFTAANSESLSIASNSTLQLGDIDFTIAGWAYLDSKTTARSIAGKRATGGTTDLEFTFVYDNATDRFVLAIGDSSNISTVAANNLGSPSTGTWYYVVGWRDKTAGTINIQVNNGTVDSATVSRIPQVGTATFRVGAQQNTAAVFWNGRIDSLGFWKRTLTAAERTWLYNSGNGRVYADIGQSGTDGSALTTNLISWWNLDELSGTRYDSHSTNHLTDNNTVTQAVGIAQSVARDTNFAAQFTAANSEYLSIADNATFSTGDIDFWIAGWVYLDAVAANQGLVTKDAGANNREYGAYYNIADGIRFYVFHDGTTIKETPGAGILTAGTWNFFIGWHDSVNNTVNIKVNNGTTQSSAHTTGVFDGTAALELGRFATSNYLGGRLDSVAFGKSPSGGIASVISAINTSLFNNGRGKKYADLTAAEKSDWGLVSWWNLDESSGNRSDSHGSNTLTDNNTVTQAQGVNYVEGVVSLWTDNSSNNSDLVQVTQSKRPALISNSLNGKRGVKFDGTDDALQASSVTIGAFTYFVVMKLTGTAGMIYEHSADAGTNPGSYMYGTTGNSLQVKRGTASSSKNFTADWAVDNAAKITVQVFDGTHAGHLLYINGASQSLTNVSADEPGTAEVTAALNVGARNDGASLPSNGLIYEIIVYNRALTATERGKVERYLSSKYGVSLS